jgi:eukaryotic-like serine/threonine-protein kinase
MRRGLPKASSAGGGVRALSNAVYRRVWTTAFFLLFSPRVRYSTAMVVGQVVDGKYKVLRSIGVGGMGAIWEAEHVKLGVRVCVKTIHRHLLESDEHRKRFELEARASAKLKSPYVVKVTDVDSLPDGTPYMVMEYLEGKTLASCRDFAAANVSVLIDWCIQICLGLHEAHQAGLIHRDIKPSNIFIVGKDSPESAKLLDFGIAKAMNAHPEDPNAPTTKTGSFIGTISYMSPEQIRGDDLDARADVWSMGMLLYRILTNESPFRSSGHHEAAMIGSILVDAPVPIGKHRPGLSAALADIVMRCLEKDRSARPLSALALAASLAPFATLAGAGLVNPRVSLLPSIAAPPPVAKSSSKERWIGVALVGLAFMAGLGGYTLLRPKATRSVESKATAASTPAPLAMPIPLAVPTPLATPTATLVPALTPTATAAASAPTLRTLPSAVTSKTAQAPKHYPSGLPTLL